MKQPAMTMTQKILAHSAGKPFVCAGDYIEAKLDLVLGNDITAPIAIESFYNTGAKHVFDKSKVALVPDHFTPNKDIQSAMQSQMLRKFAKEQAIENYFEIGKMGIEHVLIPELGLALPGDVIIGADSHTCTYGALGAFSTGVGSTDMAAGMISGTAWFKVPEAIEVSIIGTKRPWVSGKDVILTLIGILGVEGANYMSIEFKGPSLSQLSIDDRFTMSNMVIEAGAKNGIFPVDEKTHAYLSERTKKTYICYEADKKAIYAKKIVLDLDQIEPVIAFPHLPENVRNVSSIETIHIDQVIIGSCTNGRMEDMRIAASILKGRSVSPETRVIIIPGSQEVYKKSLQEGLLEIFIDAGCAVSTPTCGPCLGGHMGILAEGEKALATTNRNFVGRMGHITSEVDLASPAIAAATAIQGYICAPDLPLSSMTNYPHLKGGS
jgi:3-isopropylmalate/(R)-2-methylmalate dehydratase large subunit